MAAMAWDLMHLMGMARRVAKGDSEIVYNKIVILYRLTKVINNASLTSNKIIFYEKVGGI